MDEELMCRAEPVHRFWCADVLVYQIWYEGGYLQPQPVNGYSRFILQQPTVDGCDPRQVSSQSILITALAPAA